MKLSYIVSGFVLLVACVGWRLGIGREPAPIDTANTTQMRTTNDTMSQSEMNLRTSLVELAAVKPELVEPIGSSSPTIEAAASGTLISTANSTNTATAATEVAFEELSYCEQMDALDRAGKSVSQFVLSSGQFSQYDEAQQSNCPWHQSQLDLAYRVLYPPAIATISAAPDTSYTGDSHYGDNEGDAVEYENNPENRADTSPSIAPPPPYRPSRRQWLRYQQRRAADSLR